MEKICSKCKKFKKLSEFQKDLTHKDKHGTQCADCKNEATRKRQRTPRGRLNTYKCADRYRDKLKIEIFSHYSPSLVCQSCGFDNIDALSIDHVGGGGNKHRREIGARNGLEFYQWIRNNNYPSGFQVICMNCQFIRRAEQFRQKRNRDIIEKACLNCGNIYTTTNENKKFCTSDCANQYNGKNGLIGCKRKSKKTNSCLKNFLEKEPK